MGEVSGALLPGDEAAVDPAEDGGRPVHGVLAMPAGTAARRHRFQPAKQWIRLAWRHSSQQAEV